MRERIEVGAAVVVLLTIVAVVLARHEHLSLRGEAIGAGEDTGLHPPEDAAIPERSAYAYAEDHHAKANGAPIPVAWANRGALRRLQRLKKRGVTPGVVIVPGFVPLGAEEPVKLHWIARQRLRMGLSTLRARDGHLIVVSGGNVHPDDTPHNEAWEMRRYLIEEMGVPEDRILIEPYARHSTTNLRNVGRLLLSAGVGEAVVVTTAGQGFYFGRSDISGFQDRSLRELGYEIGQLTPLNTASTRVLFRPSADVWTRGDDPLDP